MARSKFDKFYADIAVGDRVMVFHNKSQLGAARVLSKHDGRTAFILEFEPGNKRNPYARARNWGIKNFYYLREYNFTKLRPKPH